jgi:hypothetical protein
MQMRGGGSGEREQQPRGERGRVDRRHRVGTGAERILDERVSADQESRDKKQRKVALQRIGMQCQGEDGGCAMQTLHGFVIERLRIACHLRVLVEPIEILQQEIDKRSARERCYAHCERQIETVPDREIVFGQRARQHAARREREDRCDRVRRRHAHREAQGHQHFHRNLHPTRRFMGRAREIHVPTVKKHIVDEPRRISDAEDAAEHCGKRRQPAKRPPVLDLQRFGEEHFLA